MKLFKKEKVVRLLEILRKKSVEDKVRFLDLLSKKFENKFVRVFETKIDDSVYCKYYKIIRLEFHSNGDFMKCLFHDSLDTSKKIMNKYFNIDYRDYEWDITGEILEDGYGSLLEHIEEFMKGINEDVIQNKPYKKFVFTVYNHSSNKQKVIEIFDKFEDSARNRISMFEYTIEDVEIITNFGKVVVVKSNTFNKNIEEEYKGTFLENRLKDRNSFSKFINVTENDDELIKFKKEYPDYEILKTYTNLEIISRYDVDTYELWNQWRI